MPGALPGARNTARNKTDKFLHHCAHTLRGKTDSKQIESISDDLCYDKTKETESDGLRGNIILGRVVRKSLFRMWHGSRPVDQKEPWEFLEESARDGKTAGGRALQQEGLAHPRRDPGPIWPECNGQASEATQLPRQPGGTRSFPCREAGSPPGAQMTTLHPIAPFASRK